jgi:hypothetical protein
MKNIFLAFTIIISYFDGKSQNCLINSDSLILPKRIEYGDKKYLSKIVCVKYLTNGKMGGTHRGILKEVLIIQNLKLSTFGNTSIEFCLKDTNRIYYVPVKESKQFDRLVNLKYGTVIKVECIIFKDYFVYGENFFYINKIIF